MRTLVFLFVFGSLAGCARDASAPALSEGATACKAAQGGAVTVDDAWIREQPNEDGMSAAYFAICNGATAPATLSSIETPVAAFAELHETTRDANGVVAMAPTGEIVLAPGERVVFEPGGKHVMLMDLEGPVVSGDVASLTLRFDDGSSVSADAVARSAVEAAGEHREH